MATGQHSRPQTDTEILKVLFHQDGSEKGEESHLMTGKLNWIIYYLFNLHMIHQQTAHQFVLVVAAKGRVMGLSLEMRSYCSECNTGQEMGWMPVQAYSFYFLI